MLRRWILPIFLTITTLWLCNCQTETEKATSTPAPDDDAAEVGSLIASTLIQTFFPSLNGGTDEWNALQKRQFGNFPSNFNGFNGGSRNNGFNSNNGQSQSNFNSIPSQNFGWGNAVGQPFPVFPNQGNKFQSGLNGFSRNNNFQNQNQNFGNFGSNEQRQPQDNFLNSFASIFNGFGTQNSNGGGGGSGFGGNDGFGNFPQQPNNQFNRFNGNLPPVQNDFGSFPKLNNFGGGSNSNFGRGSSSNFGSGGSNFGNGASSNFGGGTGSNQGDLLPGLFAEFLKSLVGNNFNPNYRSDVPSHYIPNNHASNEPFGPNNQGPTGFNNQGPTGFNNQGPTGFNNPNPSNSFNSFNGQNQNFGGFNGPVGASPQASSFFQGQRFRPSNFGNQQFGGGFGKREEAQNETTPVKVEIQNNTCGECVDIDISRLIGPWTQIYGNERSIKAIYSRLALLMKPNKQQSEKVMKPSCVGMQFGTPRKIGQHENAPIMFFFLEDEADGIYQDYGSLLKDTSGTLFLNVGKMTLPMCVLKHGPDSSTLDEYIILTETMGSQRCKNLHIFARRSDTFYRDHNRVVADYLRSGIINNKYNTVSTLRFPENCESEIPNAVEQRLKS